MHNKKPVQRILSLCLAIAIVLGIAIGTIVPAFAAPTKDMMVTDNAGMLTAEQESEIEDMLYAINQRTGVELAVYTIETLNGQDIETKANDLFRELGLGDSEKNNGLLLLIALNDRKFRLEVGYGLEGTIPDTKAAEIINTMTPYFKESNYADGIKAAVSKTENVLNGEADTTTEKCRDCGKEFETKIEHVVYAVENGTTGCPVCNGRKVVPGINDLASRYPKVAAMWSNKNEKSALEVTAKTDKKAIFKCPDCGKEFKAQIGSVVDSVNNGFTGCYDCMMRRVNAISKPEWFYTRPMLAFAGENGIANPFFDVRNILGENSLLGLDFVDHIQRLIYEYNGKYPHADAAEKDRFKFEAVRKAGYKGIRVLEPGLEVLDPKYDIVMPEGFRDSGGRYNAEIMEEVGRKVIHLLEEIYGRKASPEIWALTNFKEFEIWYDANKKELEANARKKGPKGKTAAKMAA